MVDTKAYKIAKFAIMFATIFVAMLLDKSINIVFLITTAMCTLLVTFSYALLEDSWTNCIVAFFMFGVASFVKEFIFPGLIATAYPVYAWPLVTIVPRLLVGVSVMVVYRLTLLFVGRVKNARTRQIIRLVTATAVGLVLNTLYFFAGLNVCLPLAFEGKQQLIVDTIKAFAVVAIIPEYAVSILGVSFVVLGVRRGLKISIDGKVNKGENTL